MAPDRPPSPGGQAPDLPFLDRLARRMHFVRQLNAARRATPAGEADDLPDEVLPPRRLLPVERWRLLATGVFLLLVAAVAGGLWSVLQPRPVAILEGHTAPVRGLAFSPDGSLLASGGDDCTVRIWHLASGEPPLTIRHNVEVRWLAFVPGADLLATSTGFGFYLWDPETGAQHGSFSTERPNALFALSPDGKMLAAQSASKSLPLYEMPGGKECQRLLGPKSMVCGVAFSPDGKTLAAGSYDCWLRVWDLKTTCCLATISTLTNNESLAFSPDGQLLAAEGGVPSRLLLWDPQSGQERRGLGILDGMLLSVQFSPDGRLLVSTSGACNQGWWVMLWDVATGRRLARLPVGAFSPAAFSRDGRKLATVGSDNEIRIWNVGELAGTEW